MFRRLKQLAIFGLAAFLLAMTAIVVAGMHDRISNADLIVVPGNTVGPDGKPSPRLQARLDAALQLFQEQHAPLIFVSGGKGKEGFDEAVSMSAYLVEHGVSSSAIVQDHWGNDTEATAKNAAHFMQEKNLRTALVATQYFHVPRTTLALERHGVQVNGSLHPRFFELRDLYSIPREVVGYVVYMVKAKL